MTKIVKTLVVLAIVSAVAVPIVTADETSEALAKSKAPRDRGAIIKAPTGRLVPSHPAQEVQYTKFEKEFYLTDD